MMLNWVIIFTQESSLTNIYLFKVNYRNAEKSVNNVQS